MSRIHKSCTKCGRVQALSEFHKNKRARDGRASSCKDCYRRYWQETREAQLKTRRIWKRNNAEKIKDYMRTWRQDNHECVVRQARNWRAENPERIRAYYEENRERHLAVCQSWKKENPERVRHYCAARRARVKEALGSHTVEEWLNVCEAYEHRCAHCGDLGARLTKDHIIPLALGGSDYVDNIQPLCRPCNSRKGVRLYDEDPRAMGLGA